MAWTQASFPAGGPGSRLHETLERCTRALLSQPRYKDDLRYLRVWIQYVRARRGGRGARAARRFPLARV